MSNLELDDSKPIWRNRTRHFKVGFKFRLAPERLEDLKTLLATWQMNEGNDYRLSQEESRYATIAPQYPTMAFISFRRKRQGMLFKFSWIPCEFTSDTMRVILPIIRNVMPTLIAQDICGVSPMMGPSTEVFSLRRRPTP